MNFRGNNCAARDGNVRVYTTQISSDRTARIPGGRVCMHVSIIQYVHFEMDWGKILDELNFEVDCDILSSQKEIFMSSRNSANCI